jgi:Ser/Thr protein kinase RdoA (MazF antagonist)
VTPAQAALSHWEIAADVTLRPVTGGLINQTFSIEAQGRPVGIFQRLNTAIFSPYVHEDIDAITSHLEASGLATPRLFRTASGALWHEDGEGAVWRAMSFLGNRTIERLEQPEDAYKAGELLARFHSSLANFDWDFRSVRPGSHDTEAHLQRLAEAIGANRGHRLWEQVNQLGRTIAEGWSSWEGPRALPQRIIHGDLKISNVRFQDREALCLIDLDTMGHGTLDVELGDAMRSWCNPSAENTAKTEFDLSIFRDAMSGYASGAAIDPPSGAEWDSIVRGTERICWELAARFAWDALAECYFGFEPQYGGHGEHNLLRARGQARLAQSVRDQRREAEAVMAKLRP